MSATNRGAERVESDDYPTPAWCVDRLLDRLHPLASGGRWLEPCAGDGAIIRAVRAWVRGATGRFVRRFPVFTAIDIGRDALGSDTPSVAFCRGDYLATPPLSGPLFDVIITNPPYSRAFETAQKAVTEAHTVALLLRLNVLGSGLKSGRSEWLRKNMPDVYVLPNRPAFVASYKCRGAARGGALQFPMPCGWHETRPIALPRIRVCPKCGAAVSCSTTDATEYAWFVWEPTRQVKRLATIEILDETSAGERTLPMFAEEERLSSAAPAPTTLSTLTER